MRHYQQLLLAIAVMGVIMITSLLTEHWSRHNQERDRMLGFSREIGEIRRLSEISSMSVRMAAIARDTTYIERYHNHMQPLVSRVEDINKYLDSLADRTLIADITGALEDAALIETEAISHVLGGNAIQAVVLTQSADYRTLKQRGRHALALAEAQLGSQFRLAADREQRKLTELIGALCLTLGVLVAMLFCFRWEKAEKQRRKTQIDTQRILMASVMDAQNNFLNNMVYFRTKAESGLGMDESELRMIDEAIHDARHRMIEIAETDDFETRDLGGLHVLKRSKRARKIAS